MYKVWKGKNYMNILHFNDVFFEHTNFHIPVAGHINKPDCNTCSLSDICDFKTKYETAYNYVGAAPHIRDLKDSHTPFEVELKCRLKTEYKEVEHNTQVQETDSNVLKEECFELLNKYRSTIKEPIR